MTVQGALNATINTTTGLPTTTTMGSSVMTTLMNNDTDHSGMFKREISLKNVMNCSLSTEGTCKFGLLKDYQVYVIAFCVLHA